MHIPVVIIGSGVIGLSIAYELINKKFDLDFVLFEKNIFPSEESTGRNSGVLHAGLYYPAGSLKLKYCLEGNKKWRQWSHKLNFDVNNCGKYIIASKDQCEQIQALMDHAKLNGLNNLRWASNEEIERLYEFCHVQKAFYSQTTAVIDLAGSVSALKNEIEKKAVPILYENPVLRISKSNGRFYIESQREKLSCDILINCSGLGAVTLRKMLGLNDLTDYYVKGHYLNYSKPFFNESLLYPLPQKDLMGLGIHTSFDMDGSLRFGPNAQEVARVSYGEENNYIGSMEQAIEQTFKKIDLDALSFDYCGIRSKLKKHNQVYHDFWVGNPNNTYIENYYELCGIDSPGLTSAPAIAGHIVQMIMNRG